MSDMVNHPPHYTDHPVFPGECIDYTSGMTFAQGNAFKYLWRAGQKGKEHEDLKKAIFYITRPCRFKERSIDGSVVQDLKKSLREYIQEHPEDTEGQIRAILMIMIASGRYNQKM